MHRPVRRKDGECHDGAHQYLACEDHAGFCQHDGVCRDRQRKQQVCVPGEIEDRGHDHQGHDRCQRTGNQHACFHHERIQHSLTEGIQEGHIQHAQGRDKAQGQHDHEHHAAPALLRLHVQRHAVFKQHLEQQPGFRHDR